MTEEMKNNDETDETLWQIHRNITLSRGTLERIIAGYRGGKILDPLKIEAVKSHLNRALTLLQEEIEPIQSEEDRDW